MGRYNIIIIQILFLYKFFPVRAGQDSEAIKFLIKINHAPKALIGKFFKESIQEGHFLFPETYVKDLLTIRETDNERDAASH